MFPPRKPGFYTFLLLTPFLMSSVQVVCNLDPSLHLWCTAKLRSTFFLVYCSKDESYFLIFQQSTDCTVHCLLSKQIVFKHHIVLSFLHCIVNIRKSCNPGNFPFNPLCISDARPWKDKSWNTAAQPLYSQYLLIAVVLCVSLHLRCTNASCLQRWPPLRWPGVAIEPRAKHLLRKAVHRNCKEVQ